MRLTCICAFVTLFREQKLKFNTKVHRSVPQFIGTLGFREKKKAICNYSILGRGILKETFYMEKASTGGIRVGQKGKVGRVLF